MSNVETLYNLSALKEIPVWKVKGENIPYGVELVFHIKKICSWVSCAVTQVRLHTFSDSVCSGSGSKGLISGSFSLLDLEVISCPRTGYSRKC